MSEWTSPKVVLETKVLEDQLAEVRAERDFLRDVVRMLIRERLATNRDSGPDEAT